MRTPKRMAKFVRDDARARDRKILDDGKCKQGVRGVAGRVDHECETAARKIRSVEHQAHEVRTGLVAERMQFVHLPVGRTLQRRERLVLHFVARALRLVVRRLRHLHEFHPRRDEARGEIAVHARDRGIKRTHQCCRALRARERGQHLLRHGHHHMHFDALRVSCDRPGALRQLAGGRGIGWQRGRGECGGPRLPLARGDQHRSVNHLPTFASAGRHEGRIHLIILGKLGRRHPQDVHATFSVVDGGVEKPFVIRENRPTRRPTCEMSGASEPIRPEHFAGIDHDREHASIREGPGDPPFPRTLPKR